MAFTSRDRFNHADLEIVRMATAGNLNGVKACIQRGDNIEACEEWTETDWSSSGFYEKSWTWKKDTALLAAGRFNHIEIVSLLLSHGANLDHRSCLRCDEHDTITSVVTKKGYTNILQIIEKFVFDKLYNKCMLMLKTYRTIPSLFRLCYEKIRHSSEETDYSDIYEELPPSIQSAIIQIEQQEIKNEYPRSKLSTVAMYTEFLKLSQLYIDAKGTEKNIQQYIYWLGNAVVLMLDECIQKNTKSDAYISYPCLEQQYNKILQLKQQLIDYKLQGEESATTFLDTLSIQWPLLLQKHDQLAAEEAVRIEAALQEYKKQQKLQRIQQKKARIMTDKVNKILLQFKIAELKRLRDVYDSGSRLGGCCTDTKAHDAVYCTYVHTR